MIVSSTLLELNATVWLFTFHADCSNAATGRSAPVSGYRHALKQTVNLYRLCRELPILVILVITPCMELSSYHPVAPRKIPG